MNSLTANSNLLVQIAMGVALLVGMLLARAGRYRAHGICQAIVVLLNLAVIASYMSPAFRKGTAAATGGLGDPFVGVATAHAVLGGIAELLGIYMLLNAGTRLLPRALRFSNYRPWMRSTLALWWVVIAFGVGTYYFWNVDDGSAAPVRTAPTREIAPPAPDGGVGDPGPKTIDVAVRNNLYEPREVTVEVGDSVVWTVEQGRHTMTADEKSFDSPLLTAGGEFTFVFTQPGTIVYYCEIHGSPGGIDMAAVITVVPRARG